MNLRNSLSALALLFTPTLAFAHPGHGTSGLLAGLGHPLGGLDHLLAMLAVGLWAAQQQGQATGRCPWPLSPACCSAVCSVLPAPRCHGWKAGLPARCWPSACW